MNWNHILHILRKDIRAQRFHLILWCLLLALYAIILGQSDLGRPDASALTIVAHLLPGVVTVYGLVIVVVLIHHDPVAGTSAFWMTRPIRGASLLVAKAVEATAMATLWFFADLLVLVANGAADHFGYLAFGFATSLLPIMLVVFAIAALAPNTPRFFLTLALVLVGFVLVAMALNFVTAWFFVSDSATENSRTPAESLSARVVGATIASLGAFAILAWQFVTRRTRVSIVAAGIVAAGTSVALSSWSHDFILPRAAPGDRFEEVRVEISSSNFGSGTLSIGDVQPIEYQVVSAPASIHGMPAGVFFEEEPARTRVITADGHEFLQQPTGGAGWGLTASLNAALDGPILPGSTGNSWGHTIVRAVEDEFEQFAHQPCTVESEVSLKLYRYELLGELPIEVGAKLRYGGLRVQITDAQATSTTDSSQPATNSSFDGHTVYLSVKYPNSKLKAVRAGGGDRPLYSNLTFILVNRQRNEALRSNGGGSSSHGGIRTMFRVSDRHVDFRPAYTGSGDERSPNLDEEWLAGASLAILHRKSLGEIARTVKLEDAVFEPKR